MQDNNLLNITLLYSFRNQSYLPISGNTLVFSFILLFIFFFGFIYLGNDGYAVLAFKPTVPTDQNEDQQLQKEQPSSKQISDEYVFVKKWGSYGTGPGQFTDLGSIAIDLSGNVYVVDADRIQKFNSNGDYKTQWGSNGTGDGQFHWPFGIATDSLGYVYVVESDESLSNENDTARIQKFDSNGNFIDMWGKR